MGLLQDWWSEVSSDLFAVDTWLGFLLILVEIAGLVVLGVLLTLLMRRVTVPLNRVLRTRFHLVIEAHVVRTTVNLAIWFVVLYLALLLIPGVGPGTAQLLSAAVAIVLAISSQSVLSNAMAGVMLRLTKPYAVGDLIQVGEDGYGVVLEIGMLHTRLKDTRRHVVTIPNGLITATRVLNLSRDPVVVHTAVSLGYDVPRDLVETVLKEAAEHIGLATPSVLITSLEDHVVVYEINGVAEDGKNVVVIESNLRKAVIDALHTAEIEITSPTFQVMRTARKDVDSTVPVGQRVVPILSEDGVTVALAKEAKEEAELRVSLLEVQEAAMAQGLNVKAMGLTLGHVLGESSTDDE